MKSPLLRLSVRVLMVVWVLLLLSIGAGFWLGRSNQNLLLAFKSDRTGSNQIYVLDNGTQHIRIANESGYDQSHPAWDTHNRLIYSTYPAPLHLSMLDWTHWRTASFQPSGSRDEYEPAFAPDGRIAAATNERLTWDIVIYDAPTDFELPATAELERIFPPFDNEANELEPTWCDDDRLIFISDRTGSHDVYLYDFSTQALTNLTNNPADDYNPECWLGVKGIGQVAFTSSRNYNADVFLLDLATMELQSITNATSNEFNPAWLPDGRLSFVSDRDGNREIYVMDLETGELVNVTRNAADDDQPAWSQ